MLARSGASLTMDEIPLDGIPHALHARDGRSVARSGPRRVPGRPDPRPSGCGPLGASRHSRASCSNGACWPQDGRFAAARRLCASRRHGLPSCGHLAHVPFSSSTVGFRAVWNQCGVATGCNSREAGRSCTATKHSGTRCPTNERPYFQRQFCGKDGTIDWSVEREWRHAGDLDLAGLPQHAGFVFVPTKTDAEHLIRLSRWPVVVLS